MKAKRDPKHPRAMTVKEIVDSLNALPQDLPVFYLTSVISPCYVTLSIYEDEKAVFIDVGRDR